MMREPKSAMPVGGERKPYDPTKDTPGCAGNDSAWRVKAAYVLARSRFESLQRGQPYTYVPPRDYDGKKAIHIEELELEKPRPSKWVRLADWLEQYGAQPEPYITVQFEALHPRERPPEPDQLKSRRCVDRWEQTKDKIDRRIRIALTVQKNLSEAKFAGIVSIKPDKKLAWARVLTANLPELTPLFRYCLAVKIGGQWFDTIAANNLDEAVLQFEQFRDFYSKHWSALLPGGFVKRAAKRYEELVG